MNYPATNTGFMSYGRDQTNAVSIIVRDEPTNLIRLLNHSFLKAPIEVAITNDDGLWIASAAGMSTYGAGGSVAEAVADFFSMTIEHFKDLSESEAELAPHLLVELAHLRTIISNRALE